MTKQEQPQKHFYTINELCERWRVSDTFVRREIEAGRLGAYRIGNIRISREDVALFERQQRHPRSKKLESEPLEVGCFRSDVGLSE